MTRISVDRTWHPGNDSSNATLGECTMPMSGDGRFVAFDSLASNLVAGDTNHWSDVFVQERATGRIVRVSVSSSGVQGDAPSAAPSISSTGRYVVFTSTADNLVAGDTNSIDDVFLRDRDPDNNGVFDEASAVTTRVSVDSSGNPTSGHCFFVTISADGTRILFVSTATNLVPGDTNGAADAFLRDVSKGTTTRVSVDSSAKQANLGCICADLSGDGNTVAFSSYSSNLVSGDTNGVGDVFVRDLKAGTTRRVSVGSGGVQGNGHSNIVPHCLSSDGNRVVFSSFATNLVTADKNGVGDVFLRDRTAGTTTLLSVSTAGAAGNGESTGATINDKGDRVAYSSLASNFASNDNNGNWDVFLRFVNTSTTGLVSQNVNGVAGNGKSYGATIGVGGGCVQFSSASSDLVGVDANYGIRDVFLRDLDADATSFVSALPPMGEANRESFWASISGDGKYVAFASRATNLTPFDGNGAYDVFVADRFTGRIARVSVSSSGEEARGSSIEPSLSSDGRFVAFVSDADNLVATPTYGVDNVFVRDRDPDGNGVFDEADSTTILVSVNPLGAAADAVCGSPSISADGRRVAFESDATNFGQRIAFRNIYVSDVAFPGAALVSVDVFGRQTIGGVFTFPAMASDAASLVFLSNSDLGFSNFSKLGVFLRDLKGNATYAINLDADDWIAPSIAAAGQHKMVFTSKSTTAVSPDGNGPIADVLLLDGNLNQLLRVDVSTDGKQANGECRDAKISGNGRFVAFQSIADNLAPDDHNGLFDVFVYTR